ncbi:unnamed protein product [Rotaria sp. Silwood2]|nr:unnamed protein product [Rotaria sp. Silwood2]
MPFNNNSTLSWPQSCTIVTLTILLYSFTDYVTILEHSPQLQTFKTSKFNIEKSNPLNSLSFTAKIYPKLKSLIIDDVSLSMTEFKFVLSLTPSLVWLKIISRTSGVNGHLNGNLWEYPFMNTLPQLKTCQFLFSHSQCCDDDLQGLDVIVQQFSTPFWLTENKITVICDYIFTQKLINVYTISICVQDFIKPSIPTKQYQPLDFILKLQSSLTNVEYPPKTRLIYGTNDITDLPVSARRQMRSLIVVYSYETRSEKSVTRIRAEILHPLPNKL